MTEWLTFMHGKERIQHLSSRLTTVQMKPDIEELGKLALEIIVSRNSAREVLEGNYPKSLKKEAKNSLKELESLEKRIAYIYGMGLVSGAKWAEHPFIKKTMRSLIRGKQRWE